MKKPLVVATITILISLLYYSVGNPSFYERCLGSFTEGGRYGFLAPSLYQFAVTLVLLFCLPLLIIKKVFREEVRTYGWQVGDRKAGRIWLAIGIPLVLFLAWHSSGKAEFREQYPLFISRLPGFPLKGQNVTVFILYEFTYIFYYIGWEFFFRGFTLFGLKKSWGNAAALLFQAVSSTLLHVSKPLPELVAAFPGGIVFGLAALHCRSLRTVIIVHWLLGFFLDLFILLR